MVSHYFNTTDDWLTSTGASLALLILAMIPICIGSYVSLSRMKKPRGNNTTRSVSLEEDKRMHVLSTQHALAFPIIGSIAIFYTYLALKSIDPEYINEGMTIATSVLSTALFSNTILLVAKNNMPRTWSSKIENYQLSFSRQGEEVCHIHITIVHFFILTISILLSVTYAVTQHWMIGDLFAICLIINITGFLTIDSFWTGAILMFGMLMHDVLWISGSETIISVSESFSNAPMNIVWPRHIETFVLNKLAHENQLFTMFSITDIIIPGIFIAYCLRFDRSKAWEKGNLSEEFEKPFYNSAMIAYAVSSGASIFAVHYTKKSQSALFYIMPALILSTLITARMENSLKEVTSISPVVESLEKLHFLADHEERPDRFASKAIKEKAKGSTKNDIKSTRSVSKGKRTRSQSKTRSTRQDTNKMPSTAAVATTEAVARNESNVTMNQNKENENLESKRKRASSRISRKKQLEDYI
ncbi:hypothetical protein G6F61_002848 [Rhizopus arrhizus]|nr:hypothetical protein G6F61_002848 [Rhizopus arrhizus]